MHDVLDPRDLVPDEAEQLVLSGYPAEPLLTEARDAAAADDLAGLAGLSERIAALERSPGWAHDEPDDEAELLEVAGRAERVPADPGDLADRLRGAWLGRTVGNTLGKPVEDRTRTQLDLYLRAATGGPMTGYLRVRVVERAARTLRIATGR